MIQFLGFLLFLVVALCGFWGILFFSTIASLWVPMWLSNFKKEKAGIITAEEVRPILPNQDGVTVLFKK